MDRCKEKTKKSSLPPDKEVNPQLNIWMNRRMIVALTKNINKESQKKWKMMSFRE